MSTAPEPARPGNGRGLLAIAAAPLLLLLAAWALAIWHDSSEWTLNVQYNFGWFVPLLALYLLRLRAESLPAAGEPISRRWFQIFATAVALVLGFATFLREASPEWRLLGWVFAVGAICLSLTVIARVGGRAWAGHLAFPILFFLTAVPWPRPQEAAIMMDLMRTNASIATEALRWLGHEAETHGNLIQLPGGTVGVDEACSGVRSLQGSIMMTLFFGEMFQLTVVRRILLIAAGLFWALAANAIRTTFLGLVAARSGIHAIERWHDPAGFFVLAAGFVVLLLVALALRTRPDLSAKPVPSPALSLAFLRERLRPVAVIAAFSFGILLISLLGTKGWFLWHERHAIRQPEWTVAFPSELPSFQPVRISDTVHSDLRFDAGESAGWNDPLGRHWRAFYFRWAPGRMWEPSVLVHDPRVCLQAGGMKLVDTLPALPIDHGDLHLTFDAFHFRDADRDVFVFNCVSTDLLLPAGATRSVALSRFARLDSALKGVRHLGQRRLEVGIWGAPAPASPTTAAEAADAARQFIESHLVLPGDEPSVSATAQNP